MSKYKVICPHCGKSFELSEYAYNTFVHKLDLKLLICSECGNRIENWYSHVVTMPDYVRERKMIMKNELMLDMFVIPRHRDALIEYVKTVKEYYKGYDPSKSIFDYPVIIWHNKRDKSSRYYFSQPDQWLGRVTDIAFDYDPVCQHDVCRIRFYNQTERNKQFFDLIKDHTSHVWVTPSFIADPIYTPSEYQDLMNCPMGLRLNKVVERIAIKRILGFILMVTNKNGTVEMMKG